MRVLVVDDEPVARRRLVRLLARIGDVEVVGQACDGHEAIRAIAELSPDAVLLDIHMPGMDGLGVTRAVARMPPVIFTTAYDEHAVAAFEASAVDYLLKPIVPSRLEQAIARVRARAPDQGAILGMIGRLLAEREAGAEGAHRVVVKDGDTLRVFDARRIGRFFASDKYSVFVAGGREHLLEESLGSLAERLAPYGFIRVHRAELIRVDDVVALRVDGAGGTAELGDGQLARVSRRHLAELRRALRVE